MRNNALRMYVCICTCSILLNAITEYKQVLLHYNDSTTTIIISHNNLHSTSCISFASITDNKLPHTTISYRVHDICITIVPPIICN